MLTTANKMYVFLIKAWKCVFLTLYYKIKTNFNQRKSMPIKCPFYPSDFTFYKKFTNKKNRTFIRSFIFVKSLLKLNICELRAHNVI